MTTEEKLDLILVRLAAIEEKLAAPVQGPAPDIWQALKVDDPILPFNATDAGWMSPLGPTTEFDRERLITEAWNRSADPAGRVLNWSNLASARRAVKDLFDGKLDQAPYKKYNVDPDLAGVAILLGLIDPLLPEGGLFGVGKKTADFYGKSLQSWYEEFMRIGGTPSGNQ